MNLSLKYWRRHKGRAAALTGAVLVSTMAMTVGMFLARSASQTDVEDTLDKCGNYDIVAPQVEADQLHILEENEDIADWGLIYNGGTCKTKGDAKVRFGALEDENAEQLFHYAPEKDGRYPVKKGEIAGYKSTFEALGTAAVIGNQVELELYDLSGNYLKTEKFTIVGVLNDQREASSNLIRSMENMYGADTSETDFPELFVSGDDVLDSYTMTAMILCAPDANQYDVQKSLKAEGLPICEGTRLTELGSIAAVGFETENELYERAHLAYHDFYSAVLIPVFMGVILIVSFCSVYGVMSGVIMDRQKQLGLFRSIGMSGKRARRMLIGESMGFCLAGAAAGYGLGTAVYIIYLKLVEVFGNIRIYSAFYAHPIARAVSLNPYVYPWLFAVIFAALAFFAALLKGMKRSPLEMLHPERSLPVTNKGGVVKESRIVKKLMSRTVNKDPGVILVIFVTTWTLIFGALFMMAKSDYDNIFTREMLDQISGVDADYAANKDIYDTMMANVQFNRHQEGISQENFDALKESTDTKRVTGVTRLPGVKLLYRGGTMPDSLKETLEPFDISNNVEDFLSELNEKSLRAQGYEEGEVLYRAPVTAVDEELIDRLEECVTAGEIDREGLQNGTKVIIVETEDHNKDQPYRVGDRFTMTDTVIRDEYVEAYDFSHNTMPEGVAPAFTYDYTDGSASGLPGYSFGEKVTFTVEVCALVRIGDENLCNILDSETYIINQARDGYLEPEFYIVCERDAVKEWGLPDRNYTDVYVDLDGGADIDRFETLWYTVVGQSGAVNSISRASVKNRIMKTELSNLVLFASMIVMVVLTGIFGMVNSYSFVVKKNFKNFQILRAIGMSRKKLNAAYRREMLICPVIAAATSVIPIQIFDMVRKYAYHYAFDLGNNSYELAENGKMTICWQALFPWYIELWEQPVLAVMLTGAVLIILVNLLAGWLPMKRMKAVSIVDGIRNEGF